MRKRIISLCIIGIFVCCIHGCGDQGAKTFSSTDVAEENSDLRDEENQREDVTEKLAADEPVDDRSVDLTDYSSYLNKIWCMNGENPKPDNEVPVSFVITQIEDGSIQGYFDDTAYVYARYFRLPQSEEHIYEFYGTIYDGTAECRCYYKDGREGTLTITFCGDDRIETVLDGDNEKRCLLRPYHITDANYSHAYLYGETIDFETELGVWGTVTVHAANPYIRTLSPELFLLNEQGDILYGMDREFFADYEILEVIVEDMNEDGLEDMMVTTSVSYLQDGDWIAYEYERPLYQLENGQFVGGDKVMTEESVEEAQVSFEGFGEMDYALFLETDVGYGVTLDYYRYGIYGDFVNTVREGEETYFELCKAMLGTEISWKTSEDWANSTEILHIQNLSPDLQWLVARRYPDRPAYGGTCTDQAIYHGDIIAESEHQLSDLDTYFYLNKTEQGIYELAGDALLKKRKQLVEEMGGYTSVQALKDATCTDECGKYLAISAPDSQSIGLYSTEDWDLRRLITVDGINPDYPLAISQLVGDEESGFLVFSNGDTTYRLNYPDGQPEKIGEFMFDTTYSPDGKYLAYCTGNFELDELWMMLDRSKIDKFNKMHAEWDRVPPGWYVREVETGNTAYIPIEIWIPDMRPLYGGRCVWIGKDKLFQVLNR